MSSQWVRLWTTYGRMLLLLLAMVFGFLLPQAHIFSGLLQYLLMIMLFFSFLDIVVSRETFHISVIWIFLANMALPFAWFFLLRWIHSDLALVGFLTAATPTATATPVIMGFLRGRVDYVVSAVFLTNIGMALFIPFALPWVAGTGINISTWDLLQSVCFVMFIPLGLAWLVRRLPAGAQKTVRKGKPVSFPVWLLVLVLVTAKASAFIRADLTASAGILWGIALVSLLTCIGNFALGAVLGGRAFRREASQALGQKNNSFTVWLALTFINPLAALGPTFYVAYHNIYNAYQLFALEQKGREVPQDQNPPAG